MRLLPASTLKVVSTSAALSALGPDFRFHTPVWLQGSVAGNLFLGELVVEASVPLKASMPAGVASR